MIKSCWIIHNHTMLFWREQSMWKHLRWILFKGQFWPETIAFPHQTGPVNCPISHLKSSENHPEDPRRKSKKWWKNVWNVKVASQGARHRFAHVSAQSMRHWAQAPSDSSSAGNGGPFLRTRVLYRFLRPLCPWLCHPFCRSFRSIGPRSNYLYLYANSLLSNYIYMSCKSSKKKCFFLNGNSW